MKKQSLLIGMVSTVLLVGSPRLGAAEITTCIGFQGPLTIKDSQPQFAVVYVHNFGLTTAEYTVRFSDFNNATLATQAGSTPAGQTDLFFFGKTDPAPPNGFPMSTFLIARVFSDSGDRLLVDAETVYEGNLGTAQHRRHVGCGPTPLPPGLEKLIGVPFPPRR
jgi:hypothetical protein